MWLPWRHQSFDEVLSIVSIHKVDEQMSAAAQADTWVQIYVQKAASHCDFPHIGPKTQYTIIFGAYSKGDIIGINNRWPLL